MRARSVDVVILGAGPAGCATAAALNGHNRLLLAGKEHRAAPPGETVMPSILSALRSLGLSWRDASSLMVDHVPFAGLASCWGSDRPEHYDFIASGLGADGWSIDRPRFDADLLQLACDRGAQLVRQVRVTDVSSQENGIAVTYRDSAGATKCVNAAFLVDASGRRAGAARRLGAKRRDIDRLVGLIRSFDFEEPDDNGTPLVEAAPLGWWYSVRDHDRRLVIALMTDSDLARRYGLTRADVWNEALARTRWTQRRIAPRPARAELVQAYDAASRYLSPAAAGRWLAVGDAACSLDPLSSHGLEKAILQGACAGEALSARLRGDRQAIERYPEQISDDLESYLHLRHATYRRELRWPDSPFWQRRRAAPEPSRGIVEQSIGPKDVPTGAPAASRPGASLEQTSDPAAPSI